MELEQAFIQLSTKFLFLNCGSQLADYRNEINTLLNELNGLNYRGARIGDVRSPIRLIESFVNIPAHEDTLVVKACFLIKSLVSRQKIIVPEPVSRNVIVWLRRCLERRFYQVACEALATMQLLFRRCNDISQYFDFFISNNGILVNILADPDYRRVEPKPSPSDNVDDCSASELYLAALQCLESILICTEEGDETIEPYIPLLGNAVLDLMFKTRSESFAELAYYSLVTAALNCLRIAIILNDEGDWVTGQLGRLIGCAKPFLMYGIPDVVKLMPQRIPVSQQGIPEPQHIPISKGGKSAKTRKTRNRQKNKKGTAGPVRNSGGGGSRDKQANEGDLNRQLYTESSIVLEWSSKAQPPPTGNYQTSDSDYSENENTSSRAQIERHRLAKVRLSALALIGTLAQHVEKRIMFGYWHSLFPDETRTPGTVSLLNCVLRDPSPKCRIAAIQATAFLLHKSKPFLIQAESSKKPLVSFTPFSVTLGNMVIEMYAMLTQALELESDLTVLTQLLKGLTVFIQATPFHRLRDGIAGRVVRIVRPLVRHRDPTIKVAALMVMGFLISVPDMTEEIATLVGIKRLAQAPTGNEARSKPVAKAFDLVANQDEEEEEEAQDSESEEKETDARKDSATEKSSSEESCTRDSMSWLLQVVLEYLGVNGVASSVMPVRMECLQVLCAMTGHYSLLADHLPLMAQALVNAFSDPLAEIKLYAGRLLDLLGHAIHTSLLLKDKLDAEELRVAVNFWASIIPTVTEQIQDIRHPATLRSVCCDGLGNVGVHVYEKFPRDRQLALISLLTGCTFDEDSAVSSAAARALSVYILFPSLRDDVCYVENTIESILRIMSDPNLMARIKTSWSLGNVTDALILNHHHHAQQEPPAGDDRTMIPDELMRRILETSLESSRDNDKVRSNAVRTIGNVLHLLRPAHFQQPGWSTLVQDALERLLQNLTVSSTVNVKVKWNACYALGNVMKNEAFFQPGAHGTWEARVFSALCETVVNSSNFKVRINAAQALSVIGRRSYYGTFFPSIWAALLQALEQSDNLADYNEYKRRDALQEQLCLSLAHFLRLAGKEDVPSMASPLLPLYDAVRGNWVRVISRILPERSAELLESYRVLLELRKSPSDRDSTPASSWDLLLNCFNDSYTE